MNEHECDCPFCPLVKANVQVCDLYIKLNDDGENISFGGISDKNYVHVVEHLFILCAIARNNAKLPIGKHLDLSDPKKRYTCWVSQPEKDIYGICFHALETDSDPTPLDMD